VPNRDVDFDLPLDLNDKRIVRALARIDARAEVIQGFPMDARTSRALDTLNIARAVASTTAIEGANVTPEEAREIIAAEAGIRVLAPDRERDEAEVRNARDAMLYVRDILRADPEHALTEGVVREIHRLVTRGIDYPGNVPGGYRAMGVRAGDYVAPNPEEVPGLMHRFVEWFRNGPPRGWHPVIQAVVAHFYVVSIHPFAEGNGRTARGVEGFVLYRGGINRFGFYSLANFYYSRRDDYINGLTDAQFGSGSLTPFVVYALDGLADELRSVNHDVIEMARRIAFREMGRQELAEAGIGIKRAERLIRLLDAVSPAPSPLYQERRRQLEPTMIALYRGLSSRTLQRDASLLEGMGLIRPNEAGEWEANLGMVDRGGAGED